MFSKKDGEFNINQAARLMRAGKAFSATNQKLQEAAIELVEWLHQKVALYSLPEPNEFGWIISEDPAGLKTVGFNLTPGGWRYVNNSYHPDQINSVILFCRALAGPEGEKLIAWLETQAAKREKMCSDLASSLQELQTKV